MTTEHAEPELARIYTRKLRAAFMAEMPWLTDADLGDLIEIVAANLAPPVAIAKMAAYCSATLLLATIEQEQ